MRDLARGCHAVEVANDAIGKFGSPLRLLSGVKLPHVTAQYSDHKYEWPPEIKTGADMGHPIGVPPDYLPAIMRMREQRLAKKKQAEA